MIFKKVNINPIRTILLFLFSIVLIIIVLNSTGGSSSGFSVVIPILSGVLFGRALQFLIIRFNSKYKFTEKSLILKTPFERNLEFLYQDIEVKVVNPLSNSIEVYVNKGDKREFILTPVEFEKFYKELESRIHKSTSKSY